jgi:hypothetical protein
MTFDIKTDLRVQYYNTSGVWVSLEADTFEVEIDRGIQVEQNAFARPSVGTATVKLMKSNLSDFMNGPAYRSNMPFAIEFRSGGFWLPLFTGFIQNIEMSYVVEAKKLQVIITANDLTRIALNTQISSFSIPGGSARSFINVMNQLGNAIETIDPRYTQVNPLAGGSSTFQNPFVYQDITSGELYAQFLDAELGWLFATRDGGMYFYTRADVNTIQGQTWNSANITVSNVHSNSANHVCMDNIQLAYNSDNIANQVRVTNEFTGIKSVSTNSTSVGLYGRQLADFSVNFDPSTGTTLGAWASAVAIAANPKSITSVSVPVVTDLSEVSDIVFSDVGSALQVEFAQTGFSTLQELYMITRLNHVIDANHWELNIGLWRGV